MTPFEVSQYLPFSGRFEGCLKPFRGVTAPFSRDDSKGVVTPINKVGHSTTDRTRISGFLHDHLRF